MLFICEFTKMNVNVICEYKFFLIETVIICLPIKILSFRCKMICLFILTVSVYVPKLILFCVKENTLALLHLSYLLENK